MWSVGRARARGLRRGRVGGERHRSALRYGLVFAAAALVLAGCKPSIGSGCTLSTDCSTQGDRVCDTAQPGGYCTQLNCIDNSCPDNAVCVLFQASVPGCQYNDYSAPARTGLAMCVKDCAGDSDCRQSDGYVCADPKAAPWYAAILDDNQEKTVCLVAASSVASVAPSDTGVCALGLPPLPEAGPAAGDGGGDGSSAMNIDSGLDAAAAEAGTGGATDAGNDAGAAPGVSNDASDAASDGADEDSDGVTDGQ